MRRNPLLKRTPRTSCFGHEATTVNIRIATQPPRCRGLIRSSGEQPHIYHASIRLTCAATTRQPSARRTQVWLCRPSLGLPSRRNSVIAVAKSRP